MPPQPFAPYPYPVVTSEPKSIPLPAGLPAPVQRYYHATYGDRIPVVETAAFSVHRSMRLFGVRVPMRMRVVHQAGQGYYRIMKPTFFGRPITTLLDTYWEGQAHIDMPGIPDNHPKMNAASNLVLWAESTEMGSVLLTGPRVRWEGIDDTHARLVIPSPEGSDSLTFAFDKETGRILCALSIVERPSQETARKEIPGRFRILFGKKWPEVLAVGPVAAASVPVGTGPALCGDLLRTDIDLSRLAPPLAAGGLPDLPGVGVLVPGGMGRQGV